MLVATQVAVSLALMIAGALLTRSAARLSMSTGYDANRVIDLGFTFSEESGYTADHKAAVVRDLRRRLALLPGVAAVTSARARTNRAAHEERSSLGGRPPSPRNMSALLYYTWVEPNYFETLGIPLAAGRGLEPRGAAGPEAIVSESAASRLWPGENPLGRRLRLGSDGQFRNKGELRPDGPAWLVVGVARDTRGVTLDAGDSRQYLPLPSDRRRLPL